MLTPDQTAALNRVAVQAEALLDKTQMLELQHAGQPEQFNRTIEALTRPNPVQRTPAPYEGPSRMMTEAPIAHDALGKPNGWLRLLCIAKVATAVCMHTKYYELVDLLWILLARVVLS